MRLRDAKEHRVLEVALIVVTVAIACLLHAAPAYKIVVLNIYFLPVTLGGFFLGRYRAGVLALLCVLSASLATLSTTLATNEWIVSLLTICVWGAVLGLSALVIGTLSDERTRELEELHESHKNDTLSDALTGIANRRAFEYELSRRIAERELEDKPLSLVLVDVDHFKKFNDTYGHRAGDAVLRDVAAKLVASVRDADLVARFGGEEFAVILPDASAEQAQEIGERARQDIAEERFEYEGQVMRLTVSVGAAELLPDENGSTLLERADTAMYTSKQAGRNCSHFHNGSYCAHFGDSVPLAAAEDNQMLSEDANVDCYTDPKTGLPSRKVFVEELRRRVCEAQRYKNVLSLAIVSLDELSETDSDETHLEDRVLTLLAEFLRNHMRDADLVTRFGERQFATLMPSTPISGAFTSMERLRIKIENQYGDSDIRVAFSVSIGIADLIPAEDVSSLMDRCQKALNLAIDNGNCVVSHNGDESDNRAMRITKGAICNRSNPSSEAPAEEPNGLPAI